MKLEIISDLIEELRREYPSLDTGDVFINEMPLSVKHGILLMDTYAGTEIDPYIPQMRHSGMRLVMRSQKYVRGYRAAYALTEALRIEQERRVGGANIKGLLGPDATVLLKQMLVMNEPKPYRSSEGGFVEFEIEIELIYVAPMLRIDADKP